MASQMPRIRPNLEPTFFSRYECKYLVDPVVVPAMREYLEPFIMPDKFAALRPGFQYPISSLYLDSPDLLTYQQTVGGEKDRFKLRVRTYTDDPSKPAYFEVKRKSNNVISKRRAGLPRAQARTLLNQDPFDIDDVRAEMRSDTEFFCHLISSISARPVIRIKYLREAYQANGNEPVRITLDSDLMHSPTLGAELSHHSGRWTTTPLDGVIVEIKFTERYPWWVQQFIRAFGLKQQAVPKYVWSVDHMMMDGRESVLALGGLTLPPRRA